MTGRGDKGVADLPTGIWLKTSDLHTVDCATRTRDIAVRRASEFVFPTWTTGKLYSQAFALELGAIYCVSMKVMVGGGQDR